MDREILVESGLCHDCGNEFVILLTEVKQAAKTKNEDIFSGYRCPYCNSKNCIGYGAYSIELAENELEELSSIILWPNCVNCGKNLLMTGERENLKYRIKFSGGYTIVDEYVPYCRECLRTLTDDELIWTSKKWLDERGSSIRIESESGVEVPEYSYENLKKGMKRWKI